MTDARRPRIGLCAALDPARTGPWAQLYDQLPRSYAEAVQRAGGFALILPADPALVARPAEALDGLDALVLTGGSDLAAELYGATPHSATKPGSALRDEVELALGRCALERDLPLLGICRGMQLLNVIAGGSLAQHLPDALGHSNHRSSPGTFDRHEVELTPGSLAARVCGGERISVWSHHHQGVAELGDDLTVSGRSLPDGVVEAIEIPARRFALGLLWHPEEDVASPAFAALLEATGATADPTL
jgi:putative glutamine amidotransferase